MMHVRWIDVIFIAVGSFAAGGLTVAMVGWGRTYDAARKLLQMLDELHNKERDLDTRLSELNGDTADDR